MRPALPHVAITAARGVGCVGPTFQQNACCLLDVFRNLNKTENRR
jgi:hypothetical protein